MIRSPLDHEEYSGGTDRWSLPLEEVRTDLAAAPTSSRNGFQEIGRHMETFSSGFAAGVKRTMAEQEQGALAIRQELANLDGKWHLASGELRRLMEGILSLTHRGNLSEELEHFTRWGIDLEIASDLPRLARDTPSGQVPGPREIVDNLLHQARPLIHEAIATAQEGWELLEHIGQCASDGITPWTNGMGVLERRLDAALRRIARVQEGTIKGCHGMAARWERLRDVVLAMVQAVQYDDIGSQRLQHTIKALDIIGSHLEREEGLGRHPWAVRGLEVVIDQLRDIDHEMAQAIGQVHHLLNQVAILSVEQVNALKSVRGSARGVRQDATDIALDTAALVRLLQLTHTLFEQAQQALVQTINVAGQTAQSLETLGMIAQMATGVLQRLPTTDTTAVSRYLQRLLDEWPRHHRLLTETLTHMEETRQQRLRTTQPRDALVRTTLEQASEVAQALSRHNEGFIHGIDHALADLHRHTLQLYSFLAGMTFGEGIHALITEAMTQLGEVLEEAEAALPQLPDGEETLAHPGFQELLALFSMAREQELLYLTLGVEPPPQSVESVELF